jgi:hypothetical protein
MDGKHNFSRCLSFGKVLHFVMIFGFDLGGVNGYFKREI